MEREQEPARCCKECGEPFGGRSDKVFCCDSCRTAYNNRLRGGKTRSIRLRTAGLLGIRGIKILITFGDRKD